MQNIFASDLFPHWYHTHFLFRSEFKSYHWKCNFPMNPQVRLSVGWLVGLWSVNQSLFPKNREALLPFLKSMCYFKFLSLNEKTTWGSENFAPNSPIDVSKPFVQGLNECDPFKQYIRENWYDARPEQIYIERICDFKGCHFLNSGKRRRVKEDHPLWHIGPFRRSL